MLKKMRKICLAACSLVAAASIVSGFCAISKYQVVAEEVPTAPTVTVDTETKSAWESAGYGTDGYIILGVKDKTTKGYVDAYSDMYSELGDGTTEISLFRHSNGYIYCDNTEKLADSTAPISKFLVNGSSNWATWTDMAVPHLYIPGTETPYPVRVYNNMSGLYDDLGLGFSLRETEKIRVTAYILDYRKAVSESNPIAVALYNKIQATTLYGYGDNKAETLDEHYGTALAKTTITTQGAYVTFEIEGAGDYQIVAYDNKGTDAPPVSAMITGLFFDKVEVEEEPEAPDTPDENVLVDTSTKSAWESAGYGTDGYLILGSNASKAKLGYSNLYTKYGNDGKTEITWYRHGNSEVYYEEYGNGVDDTAPIGKWAWLGQTWSYFNTAGTYSGRNSYLYAPGTTTQYGWRLHNTNDSPNRDTGFSFELRDVGSINASVYVTDAQSEWNKVDYTKNPITVSLYKTESLFQTTANDSNKAENVTRALEDYYGEAVAETTVTTNNVYVTFALNEPGVYTIVAYYKNSDKTENSYILPSTMGLFFDKVEVEEVPDTPFVPATPAAPTGKVLVDTTTKSAWEANGYGTNGYLVLGGKKAYSNLYTEPDGNNGKTEITLYHAEDKSVYYDSANTISTDSTAPISKLVVNDGSSSSWSDATGNTHWGTNQPDLYIPGTETKYPVRTTNGNADPYHDRGIGFTLRETGKIYVTVYVLDWSKAVSDRNPITVGLFSGFKNTTFYGYGANKATTLEEHYGTPIVKTTVTSQGAYVTFEIEGAGNYQIVCYYDNQGTDNAPVTPMPTGLFFDKELYPEITSTSLSLEGDIGVNYYVGAHGQDLTGAIMQVEYLNGKFEKIPASSKNADGTYKFQVKVPAKDYAEKMKICFFTEDGTTLSNVFEYSPSDYVATVLDAGDQVYGEKLIALATALDDYGKAAANLFYDQENTFTGDLSAVESETLSGYQFSLEGNMPSGVVITDFSLTLQSTTSLNIYFTATWITGVVCKVNGVTVKPKATGVENEYCIVIENIKAKDLDTDYEVSIGGCTLTLNALSYAYRAMEYSSNADLLVAMQALYLYNQAANAYFEQEA